MEGLTKEEDGRWIDLITWAHGRRRLTVIDEALAGVIDEHEVKVEEIDYVLALLPHDLKAAYPDQIEALNAVADVMRKIRAAVSDNGAATATRFVWKAVAEGRAAFPARYAMTPLRQAAATVRYDLRALRKDSPIDRQRLAARVDTLLRDCEAIMSRWAYYAKKGQADTFNSAQLLIPDDLPGPVVLDATASQNFLWELLEYRAEIAPTPKDARNYAPVTLHVARASGLGKTKMLERGAVRIPRLLADLEGTLSPDRKVFLCLHKKAEHIALSYSPNFATYSVGHWGAVDGKNDWHDHDVAVIFGLPYRDPTWTANCFFALQGLRPNEWFSNPQWKTYRDVRKVMQRRQLTASIIQAINRVRCRRVVDGEGRCLPTDVFVVLPIGEEGDDVLRYVQEEMPGVVVTPWGFALDGPQQRVRRGSAHAALIALMKNRLPGETAMSYVKSQLGLTASAVEKLRAVLRADAHPLSRALAELGVRYVTTGVGRGARSYLLKR